MNSEINFRMDMLLKEILESRPDETLALKIKFIFELVKAELKRIDEGGEPDEKAHMTFARIFDKFSAQLLNLGMPDHVCEEFNTVANSVRKSAQKRFL